MNEQKTYSIAIVGAGPAGLYAVSACGMLGLPLLSSLSSTSQSLSSSPPSLPSPSSSLPQGGILLLDACSCVGGQCTALYPHKPLYGIPGIVNITAQELIDSLYSQAQAYSPTVLLDTFVEDIVPCQTPDNITLHQQINDNKTITPHVNTASQNNSEASVAQNNNPQNVQQERLFNILTAQGNYFAHNVIIATGGGRFQPNKPTIENLDEFESAHIHYCVKDPQRFAGKKVVITGGGDAAVDWAMELLPIAASVSIVHRRSSFRAKNEANLKEYENAGKITIYRDRCVKELTGTDGILRSVKVASTNEKVPADDIDIDADDLLVFFGLSVSSCSNWGLETKRGKIVVNPSTCETSIPGIFAIGDAISRESNVYMVVPGFADALAVAHMIKSNNKFSDR